MWKWNCETLSAMQKFVVKKISRSTNITIAADDQGAPRCADSKPRAPEDLEVSSVKMCGYLKKKRNVSRGFICISINYLSYGSGKLRSETIHALCHDCKFPEPLRVTTHCQWPDDWPPVPISFLLSISVSAAGTNCTLCCRTACWWATTRGTSTRISLCHLRMWYVWFPATRCFFLRWSLASPSPRISTRFIHLWGDYFGLWSVSNDESFPVAMRW